MGVYIIQKEYVSASTRRLSSPMDNMISFDIPVDGTIEEISVIGDSGSGTATFSVDLNGVPLYAGGARPSIATTETSDTKTGLSDAVVFEDRLSLSLVEVTGGGLYPRLTLIVKIDDGASPIGDLDDLGDVIITTPTLDEVLTFDGANWVNAPGGGGGVPTPTVIFDEPFTGGTINSAIWNTPSGGTSQGSGKLTITASANEQLTSKSTIVIDPTLKDASWHNKQVTVKIPTVPAASASKAAQFFVCYAATVGTYYQGFQVYNGNLMAVSQGPTLSKSIAYNATNHLWLRIRNINGMVTFWHSPDGSDWTYMFAAEPVIGGLADTYNPFYIILRLFNTSGVADTVEFDSVKFEDLGVWFPH